MSHVIIGGALVIAAIAAIGYGIAYWLRVSAQRQARELARAVGSAVWQKVADILNDTVNGRYMVGSSAAAGLVAAAHRLLGSDEDGDLPPLFVGGATDCLPAASRSVRIYGPVGSGKTVCARRIVIQETEAGRHVTVIRTGETPYSQAEYEFHSLSSAQFEVIDAEALATAEARHALALRFNRRDDRKNGVVRADATILIDAPGYALDADSLGDLVVRLRDVAANPGNCTRLVVLVNGPEDLCDPPGLFDTEVVLPGEAGFDRPDVLQGALDRLSRDELAVARLAARVSGGGLVTSQHERQILDGLSESTREYLAPRKTQFVEVAMASTDGFQHGILKTPSGALTEFRLPELADYGAAPIGGTDSDVKPAEPAGWHFHE